MHQTQVLTETDRETLRVPTQAPRLRLLFSGTQGTAAARGIALPDGRLMVGRAPGTAPEDGIALPADARATRQHCHLTMVNGIVTVTDLDSKNGTWVNGSPVTTAQLADGDLLRVGNSLFLLRYDSAPLADTPELPFVIAAPSSRRLAQRIAQLAPLSDTVLILGESGVGKELIAKAIHQLSNPSRRVHPLLALNCATIQPALAESTLFGHTAGAFTNATTSATGYFRDAGKGTLFLDEVGELPLSVQSKLLRAIDERCVTPVGTTVAVPFAARLVAATNKDLRLAVEQREFRSDLFARLCHAVIEVSPLRERREEILPILMKALPAEVCLTARLAEALLLYDWPRNVRELLNVAAELSRASATGATLDLPLVANLLAPPHTAPPKVTAPVPTLGPAAWPPLSRDKLTQLLDEHGGVKWKAAEKLKLSRRQFDRWLEAHGLLHKKNRKRR